MTNFRSFTAPFRRRLLTLSLGAMALAAVTYALTLATYTFPGTSTHLFTQWMGMDAMSFPLHPLWGKFVKIAGWLPFPASLAVRLNLISLVSGVISAGLVCWLAAFFVWQTVSQEDTVKFARGASLMAGGVAAFAFIFSTAVWQSSTHLECRMFDVAYALAVTALFTLAAGRRRVTWVVALVLGYASAVGITEAPAFLAIVPLWLLLLDVVSVKNEVSYYLTTGLFLFAFLLGFFLFMRPVMADFAAGTSAAAAGLKTTLAVFVEGGRIYTHEMRQWFSRPGWLFVMIFTVLPFLACGFAALRGLNNERTWSQYLFHTAMTICALLAIATPLSPESLLRRWGVSPVATTTLATFVAGYLAAYWFLLARTALPGLENGEKAAFVDVFGKRFAPAAGGTLLVVMALASLVNAFSCVRDRGSYADACADEILDRLEGRTWLVTDGMLDDHLRVRAATRGQELNLICLQRDMDDAYLKELAALVKEKGLSAGRSDLAMSVQLGVLPFLQDWFGGDPDVTSKVAIFGVPDFWYMAEMVPVPECTFFRGVRNVKEVDGAKLKADFETFWKKMSTILTADPRKGSRAISEANDPVDMLRLHLRRHVGFIANNLGVTLEDLGRDDDAFAIYELVLKTIDKDNVCSLFNEFEMARRGVKAALSRKVAIEREIKSIVDNPKRRYLLWSLSRYYGYIRSPEIFARMGFAWARSGQTGNAIAQVRRAIDFVPSDRQAGLLNMMAAIYASGSDAKKSREIYNSVLATDESNHDALIGLTRLELQDGSVTGARGYLERAAKSAKGTVADFDYALLHLMNNDLEAARISLQKVTDTNPKSLQAWALLAGVLLQSADQEKDAKSKAKTLDELETVILPRMESIADSPRNYFVQLTRALILMRKGESFRKQARDALVVAASVRQDVTVTGNMILNLDIQMDDGPNAEMHARQILRRDRHDKLANYVMGSLRLKEGDYVAAETFLRRSVEADSPIAAAQNDLAEVLHRLQRFEESEKYARAAVKNSPDLYVAWETLGSSLLDQKKNLDEAESCVKKAISLAKEKSKIEDIRMQITLARVQIAKGDLGRARGTLRSLRSRQDELSAYDRSEFVKLYQSVNMK